MTKKRSSKRALLMSGLAMLTCMTMLIGSTFAWFTDSVTSSGNIIKSGTLDVSMEWADGKTDPANTTWSDASTSAIFNNEKWEPGYVEVRHLKIKNEGTLALKYQLNIAASGAVSDLADVIDVYYTDPAKQVPDRTALDENAKLGTLTAALAGMSTTASGNLESGDTHTITIALKMQESADNDYQDKAIGSDFAIQLFATQLTSEADSFDNQYDGASTFLNQDENGNWLVTNKADLLYFAKSVNTSDVQKAYKGETVLLTADIDMGGMSLTPIGSTFNVHEFAGTFDGQNHTISNFKVNNKAGAALFGFVRNSGVYDAKVMNLTVKDVTATGGDYVAGVVGQLYGTIENCHAENVTAVATPFLLSDGVTYDGGAKAGGVVGWMESGSMYTATNCTAKNVNITAYRDLGSVIGMAHNNNIVTNCKAYDSELSYYYLDENQSYADNKVNENMGEVIGRRGSNVVESGTEFSNVLLKTRVLAASNAELENALSTAGEGVTVKLSPGTYEFPSIPAGIPAGVTIEGQDGVVFEDTLSGTLDDVTLKNIHIKDSNAQRWAYSKGTLVFEDCTFEATGVYAIHYDGLNGANITYKNCTIIGWAAIGSGAEHITFDNCKIYGNGSYGVIRLYSPGTIKNCTFDVANVNTTDVYQDGIHAVDCEIKVSNNTNVNGAMTDIYNLSGTGSIVEE